jgi:hypothetical protein
MFLGANAWNDVAEKEHPDCLKAAPSNVAQQQAPGQHGQHTARPPRLPVVLAVSGPH